MKFRSICASALAAVAVALAAVPEAHAGDTAATFTVAATGGLSISVPAGTVDLGTVAAGSPLFQPNLGTVTVRDSRAALVADWAMTATGTHFDLTGAAANPAGDPNQRVANNVITYTALPAVSSGTGLATATAGTLGLGATVVYAGSGSNVVSWNPTLGFVLSPTQVAGTYAGTVTHSVS